MFLLKCVKTCSKSYYDENKKSEMRLLHFTELSIYRCARSVHFFFFRRNGVMLCKKDINATP